MAEADHERAFYNEALEITKDTVSAVSLHHMPPGVFFVRALVSLAMADVATAQSAIDAFVDTSQGATDNLDLTLGRASVLHGATLLLEQSQQHRHLDVTRLQQRGEEIVAELWARLDTFGPVATSQELTYLGVAHGWAGLLYATLRWSELSARLRACDIAALLPAKFHERLQQLAACGQPSGRGLLWPWFNQAADTTTTDSGYMPGWCNGNAGHVFLWTLAHKVFGDPYYRALGEQAAWGIVEQRTHFNNVCCGAAGCAYAMLSLYRATGDDAWLKQARRYADRVATIPDPPSERATDVNSLYKGEIGAIVLLDDMGAPEQSRMPLFE
jgi:serine/threonine-protein kinase